MTFEENLTKRVKSKTYRLHIAMGILQTILGSLTLIEGVLDPKMYAWLALALTLVHSFLGMWIRELTTGPVSEK